ncbi:DUF1304 domain-containing protein [Eudoraea chungangensis]|uniref:DUF1304 domain-containing protein n=1 Tax=Eudoraea chungangensis TaxID=1481905 RepID=UPI0023EC543D|nr:DUF1304 domain-containing protein [Eudoraea chungangensis]
MELLITILLIFILLMHLYFLWFEMFAWTTKGPKIFKGFPKELFVASKSLAANQGLYNGFLAAGIFWSLLIEDGDWQTNIALFFLSCISVAGIFGGLTTDKKIFFVQAIPALITITLILFF